VACRIIDVASGEVVAIDAEPHVCGRRYAVSAPKEKTKAIHNMAVTIPQFICRLELTTLDFKSAGSDSVISASPQNWLAYQGLSKAV
jgi:hypothetical protein